MPENGRRRPVSIARRMVLIGSARRPWLASARAPTPSALSRCRAPVVPSRYGNRNAFGHVREQIDLIVSGGLGDSIAPIRLGAPP